LLLSNRIVVEIWSSIPITIAINIFFQGSKPSLFARIKLPAELIVANKRRHNIFINVEILTCDIIRNKTIPIGILCIKIPQTKASSVLIGIPSIKA
jgi:hypothetical protein